MDPELFRRREARRQEACSRFAHWAASGKRLLAEVLVLASLGCWGGFGAVSGSDSAEAPVSGMTRRVAEGAPFGLTRVHSVHLELTDAEWKGMQTTSGGSGGGLAGWLGGLAKAAGTAGPARDVHRSGGTDFPWAHASLTVDGQTFTNVGLRYKGNFTYMISAGTLRRSLKVELNHFEKEARFWDGEATFNLHAGVTDRGRLREAFSYAVCRDAGVAAPRTAYAEVTLSASGHYDKEYAGLYTLTEQIDRTFLKDRFGDGDGLLMKPQLRGPDYLGDDWPPYASRYGPQREATPEESRRVIEFARLVNQASDDEFGEKIGEYLDVEGFLRFLGASALVVHLDSPLAMPQNYYIYLNPKTRKFVFLPWDLDLGMAAWPFGGTPEQQMNLSLLHPHAGKHRLIDRLLAIPRVKEQYLALLKGFAQGCFSRDLLMARVDAMEAVVKAPLAAEAKAAASRGERGPDFDRMFGNRAPIDPRVFVTRRTESVRAQLAGERKGYVPTGLGMR